MMSDDDKSVAGKVGTTLLLRLDTVRTIEG
jgi:hypothetical protein